MINLMVFHSSQVLRRVYTYKADIWAVGVITYIMLSGKAMFYLPFKKHLVLKLYLLPF